MSERQIKAWITLKNGKHIPIFEGQTKEDVLKKVGKKVTGVKKNSEHTNSSKNTYNSYKSTSDNEYPKYPKSSEEYRKEAKKEKDPKKKAFLEATANRVDNIKKEKEYMDNKRKSIKNSASKNDDKDSWKRHAEGKVSNLQNAKENVDMLKAELKKHPDDVHTDYIKSKLKKAEDHYKSLKSGKSSRSDDENWKTAKEWDEIDKKKAAKQNSSSEKKTLKSSKNSVSNKSFSADDSSKRINDISMSHNNGGGSIRDDWKKVRDELDKAPAGTVMITTGNRGLKRQFTKNEDGTWKNENATSPQFENVDSTFISMDWEGPNHSRPSVEFTTKDKSLTKQQLDDSKDAAVSGKLNQHLGLDRNNRSIGNRSTPKVGSSEKKNLRDILNDEKGRKIVDELEEAEEEIRGRGIDPNDDSSIYARIRKDRINQLKKDYGYDWKDSFKKKNSIDKDLEEKERQIKIHQEQADKLNGKVSESDNNPAAMSMAKHLLNSKGKMSKEELVNYLNGLSATRRSKLAAAMGITSKGSARVSDIAEKIYLSMKA